jgi:GNAT superfamily N-acetyltransferase
VNIGENASGNYQVIGLTDSDWRRIATLRLASLHESPQWLAGDLVEEEPRTEDDWRRIARESFWSAIVYEDIDVGIMAVAPAETIRNSDTWLHSCWIDPEHRGKNITALMIARLDEICRENGWSSQGLGVWPDNVRAISSYQRLGFVIGGEPRPSRRRPGQMYIPMFRSLRG